MTPNTARQILGVSSTATQDEIKQAWKDLAFSFHPDRAGVGNEARRKRLEEKLKEVNIYEIREYHEKYWDKIPVLRSGDKELLWPFSAQEIEKFLAL